MSTELFEALRAADAQTPAAIETFDRVVASAAPLPDFHEHSLRGPQADSPCRLTYYFDTHRRGAALAREAGARFIELAGQLGLRLPPELAAFVLAEDRGGEEVLQVVLGIDAPQGGGECRGKYYLVFRDDPSTCVEQLLGALRLEAPAGVDPARAYILGVDVTRDGVSDVKVYFRLDASLAPRVIENASSVANLLAASRDLVFQQCVLRPERRQLYLHARSGDGLSDWLARRGFEATLARARSVASHLRSSSLEPWIVSFAYERRRLLLQAATVYFHQKAVRPDRAFAAR